MSRPKDEFPDLAEAMDLWREDTERVVGQIDVQGDLADRVVTEALAAREAALALRAAPPAGARAYAAAAVILIGVGIVGTLLTRPLAAPEAHTPRWAALDEELAEELIDALAQDPYYEPGLGR